MGRLNGEAYTVEDDGLIYDASHPVDAKAVTVSNPTYGTSENQTDNFEGDGTNDTFTLTRTPEEITSVTVDSSAETNYTLSGNVITFAAGHIPGNEKAVVVVYKVSTAQGGRIARGQLIDESSGEYAEHASGGTPSVIAAEEVEYAADDESVTVPVYTSGSFRTSKIITDVDLTAADKETLREKGIFLK